MKKYAKEYSLPQIRLDSVYAKSQWIFFSRNFNFELGKKYHFTIQQIQKHDKKYYFEIIKDGKNVFQIINNRPENFRNVKVYTSDDFYETFDGFGRLENFKWIKM